MALDRYEVKAEQAATYVVVASTPMKRIPVANRQEADILVRVLRRQGYVAEIMELHDMELTPRLLPATTQT